MMPTLFKNEAPVPPPAYPVRKPVSVQTTELLRLLVDR
jgi:hypothetical protein